MAIIPVNKDNTQTLTLVTTPRRTYISSSAGVTGSISVFSRQSTSEKNCSFSDANPSYLADDDFRTQERNIINTTRNLRNQKKSIKKDVDTYIDNVKRAKVKANKQLLVKRFTPTPDLTEKSLLKNNIKDILMPYYHGTYPSANWAYTNYNCLNFFTVSNNSRSIPSSSVLLYPNVEYLDSASISKFVPTGYPAGDYCLTGAFSFDFHINPRYQIDGLDNGHFRAGTILHLSSSYALSIVTGSLKDENGLPKGFRLQLQLLNGSEVAPSEATTGSFVFLSDDNALIHNRWHHVVVRWGTNKLNYGTGSFVVNGYDKGKFSAPFSSICPTLSQRDSPLGLCIGNYYNGSPTAFEKYFSLGSQERDGVFPMVATTYDTETVLGENHAFKSFTHPLKAEVHGIAIKRYYESALEISSSAVTGLSLSEARDTEKIAFYLPPFFTETTPIRGPFNGAGGVFQTPTMTSLGSTDDPFNVAMAFGVGAHYINLENFVSDFAKNRYPRLLHLTSSIFSTNNSKLDVNNLLYTTTAAKRNLTILPCDDGTFDPNYEILKGEFSRNSYRNSYGLKDHSLINLEELILPSRPTENATNISSLSTVSLDTNAWDDFKQELIGYSANAPLSPFGKMANLYQRYLNSQSVQPGSKQDPNNRGVTKDMPLPIYEKTKDPSSDQVTFFDISNLYYGSNILPGTFSIVDSNLSGSAGSIKITLKDDGFGGLYRADSDTKHAVSNYVGNIFYDEGIVVIKSPHLYFFGKNRYEISFKGTRNIYTKKYEILAPPGLLNSSSNLTYIRNKNFISASADVTDKDSFVYISGLYFHDENMNVVAKAKLAQPVIKRENDKILFRVSFDY